MYAQRAVSIYYIIPIIIYFIIEYKKKIFYYFFLIIGYFVILIPIGFVNLNKTDNFHFFSKLHQYYSFYHYFSADILADRMNLTKDKAQKILDNSERKWMKKNNIDLKNPSDFSRNVKYRNKIFLEEVVKNPIYVLKKFTKRVIVMCIIDPIAVQHSFHIDKTHPEAISNPKKYYNKDLYKKIPYALFIEIVSIIGFLFFIKKIVKVKKITSYDKFLIFNLISILYFIIISGFWGNPKYFTPCVLSLSLFFSHGFYELERRFITKK